MKTLSYLAAASVFALLLAPLAPAAVISRDWKAPGDGLLTYDTVNQREWLDLTESRLSMFAGTTLEQQYQNALLQLELGGQFAGFHPAKPADLTALTLSAGIAPSAAFSAKEASTRMLITLIGPSFISIDDSDNQRSFGLIDQLSTPPQAPVGVRLFGELIRDQTPGAIGTAGLLFLTGSDLGNPGNTGVWLFSEVPEPTSLFTSSLGILVSTALSRRFRRRRRSGDMDQWPNRSQSRRLGYEYLEDRRLLASADIVFLIDELGRMGWPSSATHRTPGKARAAGE